jgi:drug/metabolite transporter (DMT)-like permease
MLSAPPYAIRCADKRDVADAAQAEPTHRGSLVTPQLLIRGVACGLLFFVGCHGVLAIAQQHVPSGIAAVILATIPFWIAMLRFLLPRERRPVPAAICALVVGFAGVAVVAWAAPSSGSHHRAATARSAAGR